MTDDELDRRIAESLKDPESKRNSEFRELMGCHLGAAFIALCIVPTVQHEVQFTGFQALVMLCAITYVAMWSIYVFRILFVR